MKVFNIVFCVLFIVSALLQYNDPDPVIWVPIYIYAAYLCYAATKKRFNSTLYIVGGLVFVAYAIYLLVDDTGVISWAGEHGAENIAQSMHATKPWIEETREFFGLGIILFTMAANWTWLKK
jgi:Transmembrane family 220, helix